MKPYAPIEEIEQIHFVQWLELMGYKFTAIPNSTYTKSMNQKMKNKRLGLRAGFPDMVIIAGGVFMWIEMKRIKNSTISPYQREWIEALTAAGVPGKVCYGAEEAIAYVKSVVSQATGA